MNGSNFGVAVKEWRFKILRNCVLIMTAFMAFGQASAGILPETPKPEGGEIVGSWVAEKIPVNAYVPAALVQAVSPLNISGDGSNGTLVFGSDGKVQVDYTTVSEIAATLPLVGLRTFPITSANQFEGNYTLVADTHLLTIISATSPDTLTFTYTATADSLHLIRPLPVPELLESVPEDLRPVAISLLNNYVSEDDPIKTVIRFAKATDTGTPPPPPPPPPPPTTLTGDFDGNGAVEFQDFLLFVAQFGKSSSDDGFNASMDLDGNGTVEFPDFLLFVAAFGSKSG